MATFYYGFDDTKNDGAELHGLEWDSLVRVVASQLQGALAAQGVGIVALPDRSSLLAEKIGSQLVVRAGAVLMRHATHGAIFAAIREARVLTTAVFPNPEGNNNWLMIGPKIGATAGNPDTRHNAADPAFLIASELDAQARELDGFVRLARVSCTAGAIVSVEDVREFSKLWGEAGDWKRLFGSGRIVNTDLTLGRATVDNATGLLLLPAGSAWFVDGTVVELVEAAEIELPALAAGASAHGILSINEAGELTVDASDWETTLPARGAGIVGKVTNTAGVYSITLRERDVVQTHPGLQSRLEAIEALLIPSEDNETFPRYMIQMPVSPTDARNSKVYVDESIDAAKTTLRAEFELLLSTGGRVTVPPELDLYSHHLAISVLHHGLYNTTLRDEYEGAYVTHRIGGEGTGGTVNHLGPTNMSDTDLGWAP